MSILDRSGFRYTVHYLAVSCALVSVVFVLNSLLTFIGDWPGIYGTLAWMGMDVDAVHGPSEGMGIALGLLQTLLFAGALLWPLYYVRGADKARIDADEARISALVRFIIQAAFWSVLLVGFVDAVISFLRIENLLPVVVGDQMASNLGRSIYRGLYVHVPLMLISAVIAYRRPGLSFIWLALLIVIAELMIVITRFIFSYEQAFMGDLVRFWYAALFLFASAYTLVEEGHVRVDVAYANFGDITRRLVNIFGAAVLGIPLCWVVLMRGMWAKSSATNSPLLNFEVSQSGFGLYVKYLMAAFLIVFALTMLLQFCSVILAQLTGKTLRSSAEH